MAIPLVLRFILDFANNFNKYKNWINRNQVTVTSYNLIFFLLTTYILVLSQGATLVFGLMR